MNKRSSSARSGLDVIVQNLRAAREYLGLTQDFVAEQMSMPRASLSALENNQRKVSADELVRFSKLYKQPVAALLGLEEEPGDSYQDETWQELRRVVGHLSEEDRKQVLLFARFLRQAGKAGNLPDDVVKCSAEHLNTASARTSLGSGAL